MLPIALLALAALTGLAPDPVLRIRANDNRTPAGRLRHGVLTLHLEARTGRWFPEAADGPSLPVLAFGEEGGPPENPGPLIRVPVGTELRVTVRNRLPEATLVVHGLASRPATSDDSLIVPPGAVRAVRFAAGAPGTYFYWATTTGVPLGKRRTTDSQLSGGFIVDSAGQAAQPDRVFLMGIFLDTVELNGRRAEREVATINGKSYPFTEAFAFTVGDTVRWRWINASDRSHPMHLHGFYFRVDSRGAAPRDTVYAAPERRLAVTEHMRSGATMAITWVPERPGNWIFHCHVLYHIAPDLRLSEPEHDAHGAAQEMMAGLVLTIRVRPAATRAATIRPGGPPRRLRLLAQARPGVYGTEPGYGFVLQEGSTEPAPDSVRIPGSAIVLTRAEPVEITVVNRLAEPTAVHWHGIELESFYDGVPGVSGEVGRLMPAVLAGDSFVAAFTPPRAGTFIYHTHIDDVRQLSLGLYGPLVVLESGQRYDPASDHVLVFSIGGTSDSAQVLLNGRVAPEPLALAAGVRQRFRLIGIPPAGTAEVVLWAGDSLVQWRAVGKDGADLPPQQATWRPARQRLTVGETYDFELAPLLPGELRLELRGVDTVLVTAPIRVR